MSGARCIDGRLYEHRPFPDDPDYEHDIGPCPGANFHACYYARCPVLYPPGEHTAASAGLVAPCRLVFRCSAAPSLRSHLHPLPK
jgi:hypothetical protein